jgi:hypothetical protein
MCRNEPGGRKKSMNEETGYPRRFAANLIESRSVHMLSDQKTGKDKPWAV